MAEKLGEAVLELRTDDRALARGIGRAETRARELQANFERVGRRMTFALTAPLVALGAASVRAFADFEAAMSNVSTLVDTASESMAAMSENVIEIGRRTPVSLADLSAALFDIRSAGIGAGDAMAVLEGSGRLAVAGLGTTAEAADLVTSAINAFRLEGEDAARVYDLIFRTTQSGKTTISGLAQGFGAVAGTVANAGIALDDFLASVAALTTTGLPAAQAYTQIRAAIAGLMRDTEATRAVFSALQVENFQQLVAQSGGMVAAFGRIRDALGGNDARMIALVGSIEAYNAIVGLTGVNNDIFTRTLEGMRSGVDAVDAAFERQAATASANLQIFRNELSAAAIALGAELLPALTQGVAILRALASGFTNLPGPVRSALVGILALTAAMGPLLFVTGKLIGIWATLLRLFAGSAGLRLFAAAVASATAQFGLLAGAQIAAAGAAGVLRAAMALLFGTVGGLVTIAAALVLGLGYLYRQLGGAASASDEFKQRVDQATRASERATDIINRLASATGEGAAAARAAAEESRRLAVRRVQEAQATLRAAIAERALARTRAQNVRIEADAENYAATRGGQQAGSGSAPARAGQANYQARQAEANARAAREALRRDVRTLQDLNAALKAPLQAPAAGAGAGAGASAPAGSGGGPDAGDARSTGETAAEIAARRRANYLDALASLTERQISSELAISGDVERTAELRRREIEVRHRELERRIEADSELSAAQREELLTIAANIRADEAAAAALDALRARTRAMLDDIDARGEGIDIVRAIDDLEQARGDLGAISAASADVLRIERQLGDERQRSARRLIELEGQREEAMRTGDAAATARLDGLIAKQRRYDALVGETTAAQIAAQERLQEAFGRFADGLSNSLLDIITNFDGSLNSIFNVFRQLLRDLLRPGAESVSGAISAGLQGLLGGIFGGGGGGTKGGNLGFLGVNPGGGIGSFPFAGGFARGGLIPSGSFGIVGERGPEPVFGTARGAQVFPHSALSGGLGGGPGGGDVRVRLDVTTDGEWINTRIVSVAGGVVAAAAPGIALAGAGEARRQQARRARSSLDGY